MILKALCKRNIRLVCGRRYDPYASVSYISPSELGISEEHFSFYSGKWELSGSKYIINKKPKGIILFLHGLLDGRESYLFEIAQFVKEGYIVYAYDNTGCATSEGTQIYSFEHTLKDQKAFFNNFKEELTSYHLPIYVIGHSWGGYGALISPLAYPHVSKIISISGFTNFADFALFSVNRSENKVLKRAFKSALRSIEGKDSNIDASKVIKESKARVLYIQGKEDKTVPLEVGYKALKATFKNDEKVQLMLVEESAHSPHRDPKAEVYVNNILNKGILEINASPNLKIDVKKGLIRNEKVWKRMFDFLDE